MAYTKHPSLGESLVLITSGLVFALENWDQYLEMIGATEEKDKATNEEVKEMMTHLVGDLMGQMDAMDILEEAVRRAILTLQERR